MTNHPNRSRRSPPRAVKLVEPDILSVDQVASIAGKLVRCALDLAEIADGIPADFRCGVFCSMSEEIQHLSERVRARSRLMTAKMSEMKRAGHPFQNAEGGASFPAN